MICTFCGHRDCSGQIIYNSLKSEIYNLINQGVYVFYNGGYGNFDMLALKIVGEAKSEFHQIKNYIVLAYMDNDSISKYTNICTKYNAETFYPFEKKVLPRFAIVNRNKWMIDQSDYVIVNVYAHLGGAGQTLAYAQQKKKIIINIANKN